MVEVAVSGGDGAAGAAAGAVDGSDVLDHLGGGAVGAGEGQGAAGGGVGEQGLPGRARGGDDGAGVGGAEVAVAGQLAGLVVAAEEGVEGDDDDGVPGR